MKDTHNKLLDEWNELIITIENHSKISIPAIANRYHKVNERIIKVNAKMHDDSFMALFMTVGILKEFIKDYLEPK